MRFRKKDEEKKLIKAINNQDISIVKTILQNVNNNKVKLNLNLENKKGLCFFFLWACYYDNIEVLKVLMEYANNNDIVFELNEKGETGDYPLLWVCDRNSIEMAKLLIDYANRNNIIFEMNEKDEKGNYPLLCACDRDNIEMFKLLIDYANKNNIILDLNGNNYNGNYPLLWACYYNDIEMFENLINYAKRNNIILQLNGKSEDESYPLFWAYSNKNIKMIKLLIDYASENNISLDLNDKHKNGNYPLLLACYYNSIEMVELLINYANKNNIILELNGMDENRNYPFYRACYYNNIEMIKILIDYADKNNIILEYEESDYDNSKINSEIIEILKNYKRDKEFLLQNLVIAINNFTAQEYDQLDIKKDEFLIVTNWNCEKKGWVYGHRKDDEKEKGMFPEVFIKRCKNEKIVKYNLKSEITPEYKIKFDKKVKKFRNQYTALMYNNIVDIFIDRKNLFFDAYDQIMSKSPAELKTILNIKFKGEEGIDAGGLLRDFLYQISQEIGNPNYSLFQYSNTNSYELDINPMSSINPEHLHYFRFIGRIIGLSIYHNQYLSVNFTFLFYKKLLNKPLDFSDMELIDPEVCKNIKWLLEHNGAENLCLNFTLDMEDCFGNHKTIELKPDGENINVTDSNKYEYIDLVTKYKLNNTNDKEQLEALKQGLYEIIPKNINETFNELDLKYLISGFSEIDVNDWENYTEYEEYNKNDITITHFWKCVREFNNENRIKLLLFATGSSQIPVTGFKDLQGSGRIQHFKIKKLITPDVKNTLPISHTCFNRIDLPPYPTYTLLKQKLLMAISEGIGNFSLE